ncbi:MmpS family protein [Umezawaea endophytica]|uniref:MmpS family protein n=1 Tax=Umezawaea endophytica TaxID=1654476 RepID=A0A9X2VTC0_9PSEU|nr:MmpS family protein [Umezawaea endophytica]MCS7482390.1 MmpS family protein [Umezawaea endophytica]
MSAPIFQPQLVVQPRNGVGTAGFVLGLLGFLFSFVPIIGVIAWPLVIVGLVLSLVGFSRASKGIANNRGLAIAGAVLSVIGLVVCVLWTALFGAVATEVDKQADQEHLVVYEVSGDAVGASITYSTFGADGGSTNQETVTSLPWKKEMTVKGLLGGGTLTVTSPAEGGAVACRITVDGVEKKSATGSGAFSTALCSGF